MSNATQLEPLLAVFHRVRFLLLLLRDNSYTATMAIHFISIIVMGMWIIIWLNAIKMNSLLEKCIGVRTETNAKIGTKS